MENKDIKLYTVVIYTQNQTGLLQQFSLFASPSEIRGCHKLTIETRGDEARIRLAVKQIEKKIEVMRSFYYCDEDLVASIGKNKLGAE